MLYRAKVTSIPLRHAYKYRKIGGTSYWRVRGNLIILNAITYLHSWNYIFSFMMMITCIFV